MQISRFHLCAALVTAALIGAFAVYAWQRVVPPRQVHVAILAAASTDAAAATQRGIEAGLADAGYEEGANVTIDRRDAAGDPARLATLAQSIVASQPDVIFAIGTDAAQAAARQTQRLPIVGAAIPDYAAARLVEREDAPGTNVTGTSDRYDVGGAVALLHDLLSATPRAVDYEAGGRDAAAIAVRILHGQSPARIPIQHATALR